MRATPGNATRRGFAPHGTASSPIKLDHLPPDVTRRRLLNTAEAAEFCKISVPHWRRLYRSGKVPKPVRLSARKYGWRLGDLLDFIDARITGP
jgi:prophage regulatory protein